MVYLTFLEYDVVIAHKQRRIGPVTKEATALEQHIFAATIGDKLIFAVTEEVALIELHAIRTIEFHNAVGAIVDITSVHAEFPGLAGHDTIGATTIKVAVGHSDTFSAFHTDHATVAVATFGMTDREILHVTALAVHETQTEGITGIDLDAGVMLAANGQPSYILQHQLLTVVAILADDDRLVVAITLGDGHPGPTRNTREPILALQDT